MLDQLDQPTLETKERNTDAKRTPTSDQAVPDSVSVVVLDVVPDAVAQPNKSVSSRIIYNFYLFTVMTSSCVNIHDRVISKKS